MSERILCCLFCGVQREITKEDIEMEQKHNSIIQVLICRDCVPLYSVEDIYAKAKEQGIDMEE
jgi:hypothetical protein